MNHFLETLLLSIGSGLGKLGAMTDSQQYRSLGVSSAKEDIVTAARLQGEGLFPGAFCKIVPDVLTGDSTQCVALHADGAGTKSIVAYLAYRENGDAAVFASLAQDALVMNIDDLLCVGASGPFVVTNTIGRHRELLPGETIEAVIGGYEACAQQLSEHGVDVVLCGGETADLGDLVRTLVVDAAVACRLRRSDVVDGSAVVAGDLIVGLSSAGQASYETTENSGIGSNGLTLARHVMLKASYRERFPEVSAPDLSDELAYRGPFGINDTPEGLGMSVGHALLSPTRSYAPVIARALARQRSAIHGIVHCTGGGQTKCLRLGTDVRFIKDNLFEIPPIFQLIREQAKLDWSEMYQVFNMGHRMELFVEPRSAQALIDIATDVGVQAEVIGRCEHYDQGPRLLINGPEGSLTYGDEPHS